MKKRLLYIIPVMMVLVLFSCRKKKTTDAVSPEPLPQVSYSDDRPACEKLPPTPVPLGWRDSTFDENTNVNAFLPNPLNSNEVLCVVNGDLFGFNKLFARNMVTKTQQQLSILGEYLPDVNARGWVTFSDVNNNIFIVKTNGDSLKQLSFDKLGVNPKWDYSNKYIYYLRQGLGNTPPQLYQIDMQGTIVNIHYGELPYTTLFNKSDKYIILKSSGNACTLVLRELDSLGKETTLLTGPMFSSPGNLFFEDLTIDQSDENLFWSNSKGIFKCNLNTRTIDTVFKNCENTVYLNVMSSFNASEMTYTIKHTKPLNSTILFSDYLPMEWNLRTNNSRLIRIFPR